MKRFTFPLLLCSVFASLAPAAEFRAEGGAFLLDGKPLQIRSGEIHYPRVPREEWASRIQMAKAMGLNTICTYVFWNLHETKRGEYDFSGDKDVAEFVKQCGAAGMHVIVRPGPYVCAEWDLGGMPGWLLAEPGIKLRSTDPRYLDPAKAWMKRMGEVLKPLSVTQGGPVLMVQIENEFANFGSDSAYLGEIQKALRSGGYQGVLFTSDGASDQQLTNGSLPGMLKAANFGRGAERAFESLQRVSPGQPNFTAEFWVGWFDQWERPHNLINPADKLPDLGWMMSRGHSFNLYMFHGGTTRGLWTGANWETRYRPTTCCYDYSAPLDESGRPGAAYNSFRATIQRSLKDEKLPEVPVLKSTASVGTIALTEQCRFADTLPKGTVNPKLQTMEDLGQSTGFMVYRTTVEGPLEGPLDLTKVKDRVHVLLDGVSQGVSGRSIRKGGAILLTVPAGRHQLDLVVENMGRVNFGQMMMQERKGLADPVQFAGKELGPFAQVGLPMQLPPKGSYQEIKEGKTLGAATLYRGKLQISTGVDTWLDMRAFGRGMVWINGRNLGRYWEAGPSQSIFLPGCWMKPDGENEIVVLEMEATTVPDKLRTSAKALWGN